MIFVCFYKAMSQISDQRFRKVLFLGIGLTLVLLIAATAGLLWLIQSTVGDTTQVWLVGEVRWLDDLLGWSGVLAMLVLSVFLMVPVASAITSMFLDEVAQAVEDRHYSELTAPMTVSVWESFRESVNFLGVIVAANLFALILYLIFAPFALLIFWAVNGYLLGMEYFQLAARRHLGRDAARKMRKSNRLTIWLAGVFMAIPLSIPLVNLLVPILGAATFTHVFHAINERPARG